MKIPGFKFSLHVIPALLFLLTLPIGPALAADITVDADCSLANAILSANGETMLEPQAECEAGDSGLDTITIDVAGTANGTIALDATLSVSSAIVIEGRGSRINGAGNQIFNVTAGALTLKNLTLFSGFSLSNGGAIAVADAALTLNNSAIRNSGARGLGGGVYALNSDVTLVDSAISDSLTNASLEDVLVEEEPEASENSADAQSDDSPQIEVVAQAELPDVEGLAGGGLYFAGETSELTIDRSGIDNNESPEIGGGLYIASGSAVISNSTISANRSGASSGGLFNAGNSILRHVTVTGNASISAGGINDSATLLLYNSILSDNEGGDCNGSLNANLGNIIRDGSCNHDGLEADPMLLRLAGSPAYYLPQLGSPAIDAAVPEYCTTTDQRGISRLADSCDIGAAEHEAGIFTFQIQSALAALSPPDSGGSAPTPTPTPLPPEPEEEAPTETPSTCLSLPAHILVTDVSGSTQCKVADETGVGNQTLIDAGMYHAVDVFGYLPSAITVCIQHDTGAFVLLDAAESPRTIVPLRTWQDSGMKCANVDRPGTAVLMNLDFFTSDAISAHVWDLTNCTVTTTDILNLRSEPNTSSAVRANVLNNVTLAADQKTNHWYRVDYYNVIGWLNSTYLTLSDNC